jgi:hypothetical protein
VAVALASVPVGSVGVAHADSASLIASNGGYFYSLGIDKPDASPADPPNLTGDHADGVGPGHLGVAAAGGQEDKVSFLYFDMFALPEGITVDKAVVTMRTVPDAPPNDISAQAAPELVVACKAGDQGFSGDDGNGLATAPSRLCDAFSAKGSAGPPGSYQWDVTSLAQTWVAGSNDGVAFTRDPANANANFQVVFAEASTATLQLDYTLPTAEPPVTTPPVITPELPPAPAIGGVGPPVGGTTDPGPVVPNPTVNQPPAPATAGGQPVAAQPVALSTSLRPTNELWLAALGLVVALALLSLILGDPKVAAATRSTSRLSLALAGNKRLLPPVGVMRPQHL